MLRRDKKIKSNKTTQQLIFDSILVLALTVFIGCATTGSMHEWDYKMQKEGYVLHCSEMIDDKCITHQYYNSIQNTYQRYHHANNT